MKWSHFYTMLVSLVLWYFIIVLGCRIAHCQEYEGRVNMRIIAMIESGNNPKAYNPRSGCIGLCQINPKGALADWNNTFAIKYNPSDMYIASINARVADWYMNTRIPKMLRYYGHANTVFNRLVAYNAGISRVGKPLCRETKEYVRKYNILLDKLNKEGI